MSRKTLWPIHFLINGHRGSFIGDKSDRGLKLMTRHLVPSI
jgi:hypothetical protein